MVIALHFSLRRYVANKIKSELSANEANKDLITAFERSTAIWRSLFRPHPIGWHWWQQWQFNKTRASLMQMRTHLSSEPGSGI